MSVNMNRDKFLRPELVLSDLLKKGMRNEFREKDDISSNMLRALVVAVDVEGGKLENPDGSGTVEHEIEGRAYDVPAVIGPANPKNSVKARIISGGLDQFLNDDALRVFWPFFPEHISVPIKPGEHVYVMFEGEDMQHGLWVAKVAGHENLNYFRGRSSFKDGGSLSSNFPDDPPRDEPKLDSDDSSTESKSEGRLKNLFE